MRQSARVAVGCDPGAVAGGLVAVAGSRAPVEVLAAWRWKQRAKGGYRLTDTRGEMVEVPSLHAAALIMRAALPDGYALAVEGLFVPALSRAPSVLTLAEAAGEVVGPLRGGAVGPVMRPNAATWRGKVLRMARGSAAAFAARSVQCAPLIGRGLGALEGDEHVCDALHIAYWCLILTAQAREG